MDTTKSEQRQTIALLAGAMGVLALGLTVVVMAVSARAYTPPQVVTNLLIAAAWALGFYAVLLLINVLQNIENAEEVRRRAQFERFLEMLRDIRWRLLNWSSRRCDARPQPPRR